MGGHLIVRRIRAEARIFRVADLAASLAYYTEALGFTRDWEFMARGARIRFPPTNYA